MKRQRRSLKGNANSKINEKKVDNGVNENSWKEIIDAIHINDDHWWCIVTMMVESNAEHAQIVSLFNEAAYEGKRKLVYSLDWAEAVVIVRTLAKQDFAKCPPIQGICHLANKILDEGNNALPTWLAARLIKYLIYRAKVENVTRSRREMQLHRDIEQKYRLMQSFTSIWDLAKVRTEAGPAYEDDLVDTRLRKRGDEWRDVVYIDDAPVDGASLYIILSGIHDPKLPTELVKAGVPLTCLLRIERPDEKFERVNPEDAESSGRLFQNKPQSFLGYRPNDVILDNFWTSVHNDLVDSHRLPDYNDFVFRTFCPPKLPDVTDKSLREAVKSDIYERISYIVYDLNDLCRQYVKYIRSIFIDDRIIQPPNVSLNTGIYNAILDDLSMESISINDIMNALLSQVEANVLDTLAVRNNNDAVFDVRHFVSSDEIREECREIYPTRLERRIKELNILYELEEDDEETETALLQSTSNDSQVCGTKPPVSKTNTKSLEKQESLKMNEEYSSFVKYHASCPYFAAAGSTDPENWLEFAEACRDCYSDSIVDYANFVTTRKHLRDPCGLEKIGDRQEGDFDKSAAVLKICSLEHRVDACENFRHALREFFPTHSLDEKYAKLTKFLHPRADQFSSNCFVAEDTVSSSIRTVVNFREFCEYVINEEKEWIKREEKEHELKKLGIKKWKPEISDRRVQDLREFTDVDFILPRSLKAKNMKSAELDNEKVTAVETRTTEKGGKIYRAKTEGREEKEFRSQEGVGRRRTKSKLDKPLKESLQRNVESNIVDTAFLPLRKFPSLRTAKTDESYNFIGYGLGTFRVQLTTHLKIFSSQDGTYIKVETDEWLYKTAQLRIAVAFQGCCLNLFRDIGISASLPYFHLTTEKGIILSFEKLSESNRNEHCQHRDFDFRVSWPTGLQITPINNEGLNDSVYIHQSYISKKIPESVTDEECRKFLGNGTVLKYMKNKTVIVLRPNGAIVTCTDFSSAQSNNESAVYIGEKMKRPRQSTIKINRKSKNDVRLEEKIVDNTSDEGLAFSIEDLAQARRSISAYKVLDHDGNRYEVEDGLIVHTDYPLHVKLASDYEADEKLMYRADGTKTLFNSKGECSVAYPDGTYITTGYIVEEEPIICDWSVDEFRQYFQFAWKKNGRNNGFNSESLSSERELESSANLDKFVKEMNSILAKDSFLSILLTSRAEHKNYATVTYDQSTASCTLSMPGDVRLHVPRRGHYGVSVAGKIHLQVYEEGLSFANLVCSNCDTKSFCTYKFSDTATFSDTIFTSTDIFGNVFKVKGDGTTFYRTERADSDYPDSALENEEKDSILKQEWTEPASKECFKNKKESEKCWPRFLPLPCNSERNESVCLSSTENSEKKEGLSNAKTQSFETEISELSKFEDRRVTRSTYSFPYNWLFPFGKIEIETWERIINDKPLGEMTGKISVERILQSLKEADEYDMAELRAILKYYWNPGVRKDKVRGRWSALQVKRMESEVAGDEISQDDSILGITKEGEVVARISGIQRKHETSLRATHSPARLLWLPVHHRPPAENGLEWYKRSIREKIIVPYFQNIPGACFLWLKKSVAEAIESIDVADIPITQS